jgi:quercetin dioxygenase-like cupin family protein
MEERSDFIGTVHVLNELVAYQDGSIVSKEIIKKDTGTVTLFTFDKGQGLSEHTTPYDALVHVLDGKAEITISGEPFTVKKGEMVIMPANEPHALKAKERFKMLLVMVK